MNAMLRAVLALALATLACRPEGAGKAEDPPPPRPDILAGVPAIPRSRTADTTGTPDAQQRRYLIPVPSVIVLAWYRDTLPDLGWRIVRDEGDSVNVTIHAQKDDQLLWLVVRRLDPTVTEYQLIAGAEPASRPGPVMSTPQAPRP